MKRFLDCEIRQAIRQVMKKGSKRQEIRNAIGSRVFYHVTARDKLESILKKGLKRYEGKIFLTDSFEDAKEMKESLDRMEYGGYAVIIKVKLVDKQVNRLRVDKTQPNAYYLEEDISLSQVSEMKYEITDRSMLFDDIRVPHPEEIGYVVPRENELFVREPQVWIVE